jgi:streptogramin lyase
MFRHRLLYTLLSIPVFNVSVFADDTRLFRSEPISLPGKVTALTLSKDKGILWVGTTTGLCKVHDIDEPNESERTCKDFGSVGEVSALETDFEGGVWISTRTGLQYINAEGNDITVPPLPNGESKVNVMLTDKTGELLIGIPETLSYPPWNMSAFQPTVIPTSETPAQFSIFSSCLADLTESYFPYETNTVILDDNGDLWIGTQNRGLFHCAQGENKVVQFNTANTQQKLATDSVSAIAPDGRGGLWIGLKSGFELDFLSNGGGLVHRFANGTWATFNTSNSELPDNKINVLSNDQQGGVWIGTSKGLAHLDALEKWTLTEDEPKLPNTEITALAANQSYSVWVGTNEELVHLSISSPRAAIIIAGAGLGDSLWDTVENITNHIYWTLVKKGFLHDEVYYVSPNKVSASCEKGGQVSIVDAPDLDLPANQRVVTEQDIEEALNWAKGRGQLDQPLYIFMVGHGKGDHLKASGKFELSSGRELASDTLHDYLDDYQIQTGNDVILLVEACYSGTFLKSHTQTELTPRRAVITSANSREVAKFHDEKGFSYFFMDSQLVGTYSMKEMFKQARNHQLEISSQAPQLDDNGDGQYSEADGDWLNKVKIEGHVAEEISKLACQTPVTNPLDNRALVRVGQSIPLKWELIYPVTKVWMDIQPADKSIELSLIEDVWQGEWIVADAGEYEVTFHAESDIDAINSTKPVTIEAIELPMLNMISKSNTGDDIITSAQFFGGITISNNNNFRSEITVSLTDEVNIKGAIQIDSAHVDEAADIVVFASLNDNDFYMLDYNNAISIWDENPSNLVKFGEEDALQGELMKSLYEGNFLYSGKLKVYFGYRLKETGTLVKNARPIEITITE